MPPYKGPFFQVFLPSLPPKSSSQVFLPAGWPPASRASLLTPAEALTTGFHFKSTQASKNQILECKLCRYIAFLTYTVRDCISITIHCSCNLMDLANGGRQGQGSTYKLMDLANGGR